MQTTDLLFWLKNNKCKNANHPENFKQFCFRCFGKKMANKLYFCEFLYVSTHLSKLLV